MLRIIYKENTVPVGEVVRLAIEPMPYQAVQTGQIIATFKTMTATNQYGYSRKCISKYIRHIGEDK